MLETTPLTLVGNNLGERHRYLNTLVNNAQLQNVPIETILELPEKLPIDRVYKIKLASKHRHVDFIIENLKEKDMLYVSKALSCLWLLEPAYRHIVNPDYLERHLYPDMITTAVSKMKNVIELRLREPERCQEFYEYYKSNFKVGIKFLWHCSKEFIIDEISNVIDKLNPKHLRILCETCPQVAKLYMDGLQDNKLALRNFLISQDEYWNSILKVLKLDGFLFLDLIEKYFDHDYQSSLNSSATRFVMKNYKSRYLSKPELYAGWVLNSKTLAKYLTPEENKDIVIRLACAQYLNEPYTYKNAEPFLKSLPAKERAILKKQLFVDKNIGTKIEKWPYSPPKPLKQVNSYGEPLGDVERMRYDYECVSESFECDNYCSGEYRCGGYLDESSKPVKTHLDRLFDRYRFMNFERTFFEFRKLLLTEGTIEGRRSMLLVLVSKTGGSEAKLEQLLKFLVERHSNEPVNLRDAIARSMIKRAFVWRLTTETWDLLLKWATTSVSEILHTKILRQLLAGSTCSPSDVAAYLLDFSDLTSYSLNAAEKACIAERLPALLISANAPMKLLDTLKAYKLHVGQVSGAEEFLVSAARSNEDLLLRMYKCRVGRKQLLKESFKTTQGDAGYVNVLKHDVSLLAKGETFVNLLCKKKPNHDRFLRDLVLYFAEADGLAAQHCVALEKAIALEWRLSFVRPLAYLFNFGKESFQDYIAKVNMKSLDSNQRKFVAAVNANAFVVRPLLDMDVVDWHVVGAKFVCNKLKVSSDKNLERYISKCLNWKKTLRVAVRLAMRNGSVLSTFATVVDLRPIAAVKIVLSDLRKDTLNAQLWNLVKPVISNLDFNKKTLVHVKNTLTNCDLYESEEDLQADYWVTVNCAFRQVSDSIAERALCKIENLLTSVDANTLQEIISEIIREKFQKDVVTSYCNSTLSLYFRVIAKYLLISSSEYDQKIRMESVCDQFFDKLEMLCNEIDDTRQIRECLSNFLYSLRYNKAILNSKYVSCVPMLERMLERLKRILPQEEYFSKYVTLQVTMMYCKSIAQALKQKPELYVNPKLIQDDGVNLIGSLLGKYIGIEIQNLVQSSYPSVFELFHPGVTEFFEKLFIYNKTRDLLVAAVIRGLIEGGVESQLLGQHVFKIEKDYIKDQSEEILKSLKDSKHEEVKFFLYADIYG